MSSKQTEKGQPAKKPRTRKKARAAKERQLAKGADKAQEQSSSSTAKQEPPANAGTVVKARNRAELIRKKRAHVLSVTKDLHVASEDDEVIIRFDNVTKTYILYKNDTQRLLGILGVLHNKTNRANTINANDGLSFEIRRGEAVAFLGQNGAGKSTALKMITGVTYPTSGTVEVEGRVSALLELSAGFDRKMTGRENIHMRGQVLGYSDEELAEIEPRVVEFAELGRYIDQPLKNYSSGMKARLGFGLAVSTDPEILVVDEALSVGDRAFRAKCIKRIRDIMLDGNVTVLFVTHSIAVSKEFCSRGIVLDHGKKVFDGTIDDAAEYYNQHY